jgi:hypothetical protein
MTKHCSSTLMLMTLACCAGLVTPAALFAADRDVTVRLPSVVSRAPAAISAIVRIPRDADNRLLRVTLDSGAFYRSSDVPLEGDRAPQHHTLTWPALPAGSYVVTIQLVGTARVKQVVHRELHVMGLH